MVKDLTIVIKGNSEGALAALRAVKAELTEIARLAGEVGKIKFGVGGAGSGATGGFGEQITKDAEEAGTAIDKTRDKIKKLFGAFDTSSGMGQAFNPKTMLKDLESEINKLSKSALKGEKGVNTELLREAEQYHQKRKALAHGLTVDQVKEAETSAKRSLEVEKQQHKESADYWMARKKFEEQAQKELSKTAGVKKQTDIGADYRYYKNLERDAKAAEREIANTHKSTRSYLSTIDKLGKTVSVYSDAEKGTGLIIRRNGADIKRTAESAAAYAKQVELGKQHVQAMLDTIKAGGIHLRKQGTEFDAYTDRQLQTWLKKSGGSPGLTAYSREELKNLEEFAALNGVMPRKISWVKEYTQNITHMMKMQAQWFLGAGIIFGAIGAATAATSAMLSFYQNLKNIQAVTGETEVGIKTISNAAIEVAKTTPIAANEAAKFGLKLVQAGLNAEETAQAMKTVAALVTVTGEDAATVSGAVTTAMFAWKKEAKDIPQIGNTIAAALAYSRLTVEDLAVSFNYLASTSSIMGKSLEETTSIISSLSNLGIRSSTIGTGVTQLFTELVSPSKKLGEELRRIGLSVNDVNPTMNKFADIVDRFAEKGLDATRAYDLLGDRAGRQLAGALVLGGESFRKMEERIRSSELLTKGLDKAMEGPIAQLKRMRNELEIAAIRIGSVAVPAIQALTSVFTNLFSIVQLAASGINVFVDLMGEKATSYLIMFFGGLAALVGMFIKYKATAELATKSTLIFNVALSGFMKAHPYLMILSLATAALVTIGVLFDSTADKADDVEGSFRALQKLQGMQERSMALAEEATKRQTQALNDLKETWERLAKTEPNLPLVSAINVLQFSLRKAAMGLDELKIKIENTKRLKDEFEKGAGKPYGLSEYYATNDWRVGTLEKSLSAEEGRLAETTKEALGIAKQLGGAVNAERLVSQAISEALRDKTRSEAERISELRRYLVDDLKAQKAALDKAFAEYEKSNTPELFKQVIEAALAVEMSKLQALEKTIDIASIKKKWEDDAQKAKDALGEAREELEIMKKETEAMKTKDPFASIFLDGEKQALKFSKEINDIERQLAGVEKNLQSRPSDKSLLVSRDSLIILKAVIEAMKAEAELQTGVKTVDRSRELYNKELERSLGFITAGLDAQKKEVDIAKQLGRISPIETLKEELRIADDKLNKEIEYLRKRQEGATTDEEKRDLELQIFKLQQRITSESERQLLTQRAVIDALGVIRNRASLEESLLGADRTSLNQWLDFTEKMIELENTKNNKGGQLLSDADIQSIREVQIRMLNIGSGAQGLKDDFLGMWDAFKQGTAEASRGMTNMKDLMIQAGKDITSTLQSSFSSFFHGVATGYGEWHDSLDDNLKEKLNGWDGYIEFLKDKVDDFLQNLVDGFMQTMSDIWSNMLVGSIMEWLNKLDIIKKSTQNTDVQAIGTQATLTSTMFAQALAVEQLAGAYFMLATAKQLAGISVGGGGQVGGYIGGESFTGQSFAMPTMTPHAGGLISTAGLRRYHSGGLAGDEVRAVLLRGEYVVSRKGVKAAGLDALNAINQGKVTTTAKSQPVVNNYNNIINAMDAKSFSDYVKKNPSAILGVVSRDLSKAGGTRTAIRSYL